MPILRRYTPSHFCPPYSKILDPPLVPNSNQVEWSVHHGDNKCSSANYNLLPDIHLRMPVLLVTMLHDPRLNQDVKAYMVNCKVCNV